MKRNRERNIWDIKVTNGYKEFYEKVMKFPFKYFTFSFIFAWFRRILNANRTLNTSLILNAEFRKLSFLGLLISNIYYLFLNR